MQKTLLGYAHPSFTHLSLKNRPLSIFLHFHTILPLFPNLRHNS
ncbi:MAG: hypothetical protein U5L45_16830 [Saprospiraceae bacterium]|nr:hypothetical protein [Saprospiraceae bacterium]